MAARDSGGPAGSGGTGPHPTVVHHPRVETATQGAVHLDAGREVLDAAFSRSGPDLKITLENSHDLLIIDYFTTAEPAAIVLSGGETLAGSVVSRLAGPLAPGQVAQTGDGQANAAPVGEVVQLQGAVSIQRADGTQVAVEVGTPVFQDDLVVTADDAAVGMTFDDGSSFSLGSDARLVIDQLVYSPAGGDSSMALNLVQGAFSFVSGQIAKTGDNNMTIITPVATIGVRGTAGTGDEDEVALLEEQGDDLGEITFSTNAGSVTLTRANEVTGAPDPNSPPTTPEVQPLSLIQSRFGGALQSLPVQIPANSNSSGDDGEDADQQGEDQDDGSGDGEEEATETEDAGEGEEDGAEDGEDEEAALEEEEEEEDVDLAEGEGEDGEEADTAEEGDDEAGDETAETDETGVQEEEGGQDVALASGDAPTSDGENTSGDGDGDGGENTSGDGDGDGGEEGTGENQQTEEQQTNQPASKPIVIDSANLTVVSSTGENTSSGTGTTPGTGTGPIGGTTNPGGGNNGDPIDGGQTTVSTQTLTAEVIDGRISGAFVFLDTNGNLIFDTGEESTTTDSNGVYVLPDIPAGVTGTIVVTGGTDVSTGLPLTGVLKAPTDASVVTPLTTLVQELIETGLSAADAEDKVLQGLGITLPGVPGEQSLLDYDPIDNADADAEAKEIFAAGIKLINTVSQLTNAIRGVNPNLSEAEVSEAVYKALADGFAADAFAGGTFGSELGAPGAFTDPVGQGGSLLERINGNLGSALDLGPGSPLNAANFDEIATVLGQGFAAIDTGIAGANGLAALNEAAVIARIVQGDGATLVREAFEGAAAGNSTLGFQGQFQGTGNDFASRGNAVRDDIAIAPTIIEGDNLGNILTGTALRDVIDGRGGNDTIDGLAGNDLLLGGGGNDVLIGGAGRDNLFGGSGADDLQGGVDDDLLVGEDGDDTLTGGAGRDELRGGAGNDRFIVTSAGDQDDIDGGAGEDTLVVSGLGTNQLIDLTANNPFPALRRLTGVEVIDAGDGDDTFSIGSTASFIMQGGAGTDRVLFGGPPPNLAEVPANGPQVSANIFDATVIADKVRNIEILDLQDSANALSLDLELTDLAGLAPGGSPAALIDPLTGDVTTGAIRIDGDSADAVISTDAFFFAGSVIVDGTLYDQFGNANTAVSPLDQLVLVERGVQLGDVGSPAFQAGGSLFQTFRGAARLDGANDAVRIANPGGTPLDPGTGSFTVDLQFTWAGPGATSGVLVSKGSELAGEAGYAILVENDTLILRAADATGQSAAVHLDLTSQVAGLQHLAMAITLDDAGQNLQVSGFLNGSATGFSAGDGVGITGDSITVSGGGITSGRDMVIGGTDLGTLSDAVPPTGDRFNGLIDEVRVWDKAFDSATVAGLDGGVVAPNANGLIANWQFNDPTATSAPNTVAGAPAGVFEGNPETVQSAVQVLHFLAGSTEITAANGTPTPVILTVSDLLASTGFDVNGDPLGIAVTAVDVARGTWEFSLDGGTTFAAFGSLSDANATVLDGPATLRFTPDAGATAGPSNLTFHAWDIGLDTHFGGTTGVNVAAAVGANGTRSAYSPDSLDVRVDTVDNNAPSVFTAVADVIPDFTEGDSPVLIEPSLTVSDADTQDFAGGRLTISFDNPVDTSDSLSIEDNSGQLLEVVNPATSELVTVANGTISVNGTPVATFTGGSAGAPLEITFDPTGPVSLNAVNAIVQQTAFSNNSTSPTGGTRSIRFDLEDGSGEGAVGDVVQTVNLIQVLDAPVLSVGADVVPDFTENGAPVAIEPSLSASDVDSQDFTGGSLTLSFDTAVDTADSLAIASNLFDQLSVSGNTILVNGTAVATVTGGSGGTPLVVTFGPEGPVPIATVNAIMRNATFANDSDDPVAGLRDIRFSLQDETGTAGDIVQTVNVIPVADAPVLTAVADIVPNFTEVTGPVAIEPSLSAADVDSQDFAGGFLTLSFAAVVDPGDTLTIADSATDQLAVAGNTITVNGLTVATFTGGTGGAPLVVSFDPTGPVSIDAVNAIIGNASFSNAGNSPVLGLRTVQFDLVDETGETGSGDIVQTVNVSTDSVAPTVTLTHGEGIAFNGANSFDFGRGQNDALAINGDFTFETSLILDALPSVEERFTLVSFDTSTFGGGANDRLFGIFIDDNGDIVVSHENNGQQFIQTIGAGLVPGEENHIAVVRSSFFDSYILHVNGTQTGVPANFAQSPVSTDGSAGTLRIGNDHFGFSELIGSMDDVRLWNVARTTGDINADQDVRLDGTQTGLVAMYGEVRNGTVVDLTGNGNDSIQAIGTPLATTTTDHALSGYTVREDGSVSLHGIVVDDANGDLQSVILSSLNGTYTLSETVPGGLTAANIFGNGTGSVVLNGSQAQINATLADLNGISFTPAPNFNGLASVSITAVDQNLNQAPRLLNITVDPRADLNQVAGGFLQFDGANDFASVSGVALTNPTDYTIEFWFTPHADFSASSTLTQSLLSLASPAGEVGSPHIFLNPFDGRLNFRAEGSLGATTLQSDQTAWAANEWHHVAVRLSDGQVSLFIDGEKQAEGALSGTHISVDELFLGQSGSGSGFFLGGMDEIRAWSAARTDAQIRDNFDRQVAAGETGLEAYYRADEIAQVNNQILDLTANGLDLFGGGSTTNDFASPDFVNNNGFAFRFNGVEDSVVVPNAAVQSPGLGSFTAQVRFFWDGHTLSGDEVLVGKGNLTDTGIGYKISLEDEAGGDFLSVRVGDGTGAAQQLFNLSGLTVGWHDVSMIVEQSGNPATVQGFLDGSGEDWINSATFGNTVAPFDIAIPQNLSFGSDDGGSTGNFQGLISEVLLFNRARTVDELDIDHIQTTSPTDGSLVGHWSFEPNPVTSGIVDLTGNSAEGTVLGGTPVLAEPPIQGTEVTTKENAPVSGLFLNTDLLSDATFSVLGQGAKGVVSIDPNTGTWTYTPNANQTGTDTFTLRASGLDATPTDRTITVAIEDLVFDPNVSGGALQFSGTNATEFAAVANVQSLNTTNQQLTVEMWVNPLNNTSTAHPVTYNSSGNSDDFGFQLSGTSSPAFWINFFGQGPNSGQFFDANVPALPANQWNHLAVTWDSATGQAVFYVNGVETNSAIYQQGEVIPNGGTLVFGQEQDVPGGGFSAGQAYGGQIDEFRMWNTARTADQIFENYDSQVTATDADLAGYYRMDYLGNTTLADASGKAGDGTINGGARIIDIPDQAVRFDGFNDNIAIQHDAAYNVQTFTVEAWFKADVGGPAEQRIVSKAFGSASNSWTLSVVNGELTTASQFGGVPLVVTNTGASDLRDGQWHHAAATFDGTSLRLFLDGVEVASGVPASSALDVDGNPFMIGDYDNIDAFQQNFHGEIADVRLWNQARTQIEIDGSKDHVLSGTETGLIGYWPLTDNPSELVAEDRTATGNNGTLQNGAFFEDVTPEVFGDTLSVPSGGTVSGTFLSFEGLGTRSYTVNEAGVVSANGIASFTNATGTFHIDENSGAWWFEATPGFNGTANFDVTMTGSLGGVDNQTFRFEVGTILPQTVHTQSIDTDFTNVANWSNGLPDGTRQAVLQGAGTVSHAAGTSAVGQLQADASLTVSGGSLTVEGSSSFANGTSFAVTGGDFITNGLALVDAGFTWNAGSLGGTGQVVLNGPVGLGTNTSLTLDTTLVNRSNVDLFGLTMTGTGTLQNESSATWTLPQFTSSTIDIVNAAGATATFTSAVGATFTHSGIFENAGTVLVQGGSSANGDQGLNLTLTQGLTNQSGGLFRVDQMSTGDIVFITGAFDNQAGATFEANEHTNLSGDLSNAGVVTIGSTGVVETFNQRTVTNLSGGVITIDAGGVLEIDHTLNVNAGSTLQGVGTLRFVNRSGTLNLGQDFTLSDAGIDLDLSQQSLTVAGTGFAFRNQQASGVLDVRDLTFTTVDFVNETGAALTFVNSLNQQIHTQQAFINDGTIMIGGGSNNAGDQGLNFRFDQGLTNRNGALFQVSQLGTDDSVSITGSIDNQAGATFEVNEQTTVEGSFQNNGSLVVGTGEVLRLNDLDTLTNTAIGTITVNAGGRIDVDDTVTLEAGSTLAGTGSIRFVDRTGNLNLGQDFLNTDSDVTFDFSVVGVNVNGPGAFRNQQVAGSLAVQNLTFVTADFINEAGASLTFVNSAGQQVRAQQAFINDGTIMVGGGGAGSFDQGINFRFDQGLTNRNGALFQVSQLGADDVVSLIGNIDNQLGATFEVNEHTIVDGDFVNNGSLVIEAGELLRVTELDTLTNTATGTITLNAGGLIEIDDTLDLQTGSTLAGTGTVRFVDRTGSLILGQDFLHTDSGVIFDFSVVSVNVNGPGAFRNQQAAGTMAVQNLTFATADFINEAGASLTFTNSSNQFVRAQQAFINDGTIIVAGGSDASSFDQGLNFQFDQGLTNRTGALFQVSQMGQGDIANITGTINNDAGATFEVNDHTIVDGDFVNNGSLVIEAGELLRITELDTLTNTATGTITINAGGLIEIDQTLDLQAGSTLAGTGTLRFVDRTGILNLGQDFLNTDSTVTFDFSVVSVNVNGPGAFRNQQVAGTMAVQNLTFVTADFINEVGASLTFTNSSNQFVRAQQAFINDGTIVVAGGSDTSTFDQGLNFQFDQGLSNRNGALFQVSQLGQGDIVSITGTVNNDAGATFEVNDHTVVDGDFVNNGSLVIEAGELLKINEFDTLTNTATGTITINAGGVIEIDETLDLQSGSTLAGTGTFRFVDRTGILNLGQDFQNTNNGVSFDFSVVSVTVNGPGAFRNQQTAGTLAVQNLTFATADLINEAGASLTFTNSANQQVRTQQAFINDGTVIVAGGSDVSTFDQGLNFRFDQGLTNRNGALFQVSQMGQGDVVGILGNIDNQAGATFEVNDQVTHNGDFNNAGSLIVEAGETYKVDELGTLTNLAGGVITVNAGGFVEVDSALSLQAGSSLTGTGTVRFVDRPGAMALGGDLTLTDADVSFDLSVVSVTVTGPGRFVNQQTAGTLAVSTVTFTTADFVNEAGASLTVTSATNGLFRTQQAFTNDGTIIVAGGDDNSTFDQGLNFQFDSGLSNNAGGVFRISQLGQGDIVGITGGVNNAAGATFDVQNATTISGGFTNAGTLTVAAGQTLTFSGGVVTNTGTITGDGTVVFLAGATLDNQGTIDAGGAGTVGALTLDGATADFNANSALRVDVTDNATFDAVTVDAIDLSGASDTLILNYDAGFDPNTSAPIQIVNYNANGFTGTFDNVVHNLGSGFQIQQTFGANGLTVQAVPVGTANAPDVSGGVLQFAGNNITEFTETANVQSLGDGDFTLEFWVNPTGDTAVQHAFSYAIASENNELILGVEGTGLRLGVEGFIATTPPGLITNNAWQHVAVSYDQTAGTVDFFVDGALVHTSSQLGAGRALTNGGTLVLGQDQDVVGGGFQASQSFGGQLDEIRLWNVKRSGTEIADNFNKQVDATDANLALYYRFDERSGNTIEDATGKTTPALINGDVDRLNHLDGGVRLTGVEGDLVRVSNNAALDVTDGTWSLWVKTDAVSGLTTLMARADAVNAAGGVILNIQPGGNVGLNINGGGITGTTSIADGLWHNVTATFSTVTGTKEIYVDGVLQNSSSQGAFTFNGQDLTFGGSAIVGLGELNGEISDVQVWDRVLTAGEIEQFATAPLFGDETGLVGYWPMTETAGGAAVGDASANSNDAALEGSAALLDLSPTVEGNTVTARENISVSGTFAGNDVPGTPTFSVVNETSSSSTHSIREVQGQGRLAIDKASGAWVFDPEPGKTSFDFLPFSFQIQASGSLGGTDTETLNFVIDPATQAPRVEGGALQFAGNDATENATAANIQAFTGGDVTVELWMNPKLTTTLEHAFSYAVTGADNELLLGANGSGLRAGIGDVIIDSPQGLLGSDEWQHVAFTYNQTTGNVTFFVNGTEVNTQFAGVGLVVDNGGTLVLGQDQDVVGGGFQASQSFGGLLDEVRVWNTERTNEQIAANFQSQIDPADADLALYYRIDEQDGATVRNLADPNSTHSLTLNGGVDRVNTLGHGIDFISSAETRIEAGRGTADSLALTGDMSFETWVRLDQLPSGGAATNEMTLVEFGASGETAATNALYGLVVDSSGQLVYRHESGAGADFQAVSTGTPLTADQWYHVAVVRDVSAKTISFYIDGQLAGQTVAFATDPDGGTSSALTLAFQSSFTDPTLNGRPLDGQMADVRVWGTARTQTEIAEFYNQPLVGDEAGLVLNYDFEGNATVIDKSPQNNNGTLNGNGGFPSLIDLSPVVTGTEITTQTGVTFAGTIDTDGLIGTSSFSVVGGTVTGTSSVLTLSQGTVTVNTFSGAWTFQPNAGFTGDFANLFTLRAASTSGETNDRAISVEILPDDKPVNVNTSFLQFSGAAGSSASLANDAGGGNSILNGAAFTFEANVRLDRLIDGTDQVLFTSSNNQPGGLGVDLVVNQSGQLVARLSVDGATFGATVTSTSTLTPADWNHVAVSFDGNDARLFIDGQVAGTATVGSSVQISHPVTNLTIGSASTGTNGLDGAQDEIRIWNDARTEAEIQQTLGREVSGGSADLAAYFRAEDKSGATLANSATSGVFGKATISGDTDFINPPDVFMVNDSIGQGVQATNLATTRTDNITLESWIRWDGTESARDHFILANGNATPSEGYTLTLGGGAGSALELEVKVAGVGTVSSGQFINANEWTHVAAARENGTWFFYINGEKFAPVAGANLTPNAPTVANAATVVGNFEDFSGGFKGAIDETRVWERVLTTDEINALMSQPLTGTEQGLVLYYDFNGDTSGQPAGTVADRSGLGNDGTFPNSVQTPTTLQFIDDTPTVVGETIITREDTPASGTASGVNIATPVFSIEGGAVNGAFSQRTLTEGTVQIDTTTGVWTFAPAENVNGTFTDLFTIVATGGSGELEFERVSVNILPAPETTLLAHGGVLQFDGSDDVATIADSNGLDVGTGDFTLETWVYRSSAGSGVQILASKTDGPGRGYIWTLDSSGIVTLRLSDGQTLEVAGTASALAQDAWTHVAVAVDRDGQSTFFVNGVQDSTTSVFTAFNGIDLSNTADLTLGGIGAFTGALDDLRLWGTARTGEEIAASFETVLHGSETGLQANYRFDERAGQFLLDATGNNANGVLGGANIAETEDPLRVNTLGKAAQFDGVGNAITVSDDAALKGMAELTLSAWVKFDVLTGGEQVIVGKLDSSGNNAAYKLSLDASGQVVFGVSGNGSSFDLALLTTTQALTAGEWHHVTGTWSASASSIFVNGETAATAQGAAGTVNAASTTDLGIGAFVGVGGAQQNRFDGQIDDVAVFGTSFSQAQVNSLMTTGIGGSEDGLLAAYSFSTGGAVDLSGNGLNGILGAGTSIVSTAPNLVGSVLETQVDQSITGLLEFLDTGGAANPVSLGNDPVNGAVALNSETGDFTYTPNAGFAGEDSFSFQVTDNQGNTTEHHVDVDINAAVTV